MQIPLTQHGPGRQHFGNGLEVPREALVRHELQKATHVCCRRKGVRVPAKDVQHVELGPHDICTKMRRFDAAARSMQHTATHLSAMQPAQSTSRFPRHERAPSRAPWLRRRVQQGRRLEAAWMRCARAIGCGRKRTRLSAAYSGRDETPMRAAPGRRVEGARKRSNTRNFNCRGTSSRLRSPPSFSRAAELPTPIRARKTRAK